MLTLISGITGLIAVVSLIAIIRPFPSLKLPTRKRAFLVFLLASVVSGGARNAADEREEAYEELTEKYNVEAAKAEAKKSREAVKAKKKAIVPSDITFEEVNEKFGDGSSLTDLQKEEAWKSYKNKCIEWTGELVSMSEGTFGGIRIGMRHLSSTITRDVTVTAPDSEKKALLNWREGDYYTYKGRLKGYGGMISTIKVDWGCH